MKVDDELLFLEGESAALEIRAQVIDPPKPAALAAPLQVGIPGDVAPTPLPVPKHVVHELLVLLRRPQPLPQLVTSTAGAATGRSIRLPHYRRSGRSVWITSCGPGRRRAYIFTVKQKVMEEKKEKERYAVMVMVMAVNFA